jgi:hypothetical protein
MSSTDGVYSNVREVSVVGGVDKDRNGPGGRYFAESAAQARRLSAGGHAKAGFWIELPFVFPLGRS